MSEAGQHADVRTFVIVGGGQAGATAAAALRQNGFAGRIVLIGEEPHAPYERPPLSKDVLLTPETARCEALPADFYQNNTIELLTGCRVMAIHRDRREVALADGRVLAYDKLLLATGSRARRLPLLDALGEDRVFTLRTLDDSRRILAAIKPGQHMLVVGAGVIGLEMAASLTTLGLKVTVVEPAERVMARTAPALLGDFLRQRHEQRGVVFKLGVSLQAAERVDGQCRLRLSDGSALYGDAVVYGIGVELNTELAVAAGLTVDNGIVVDATGRTSDPDIFAAGDVARSGPCRLETWENAKNQAMAAASGMLGSEAPATGIPWYWTDQFDMNIQFAGSVVASEWLVRGQLADPAFILIGLDGEAVVGAVAVNHGREMRNLKKLIERRAAPGRAALQDPAQDLRKLA